MPPNHTSAALWFAADVGRAKVRVSADFVARLGLGTMVETFEANLATPEAMRAASTCDVGRTSTC